MNKWVILGLLAVGVGVAVAMGGNGSAVAEGAMIGDGGTAQWRVVEGDNGFSAETKLPGASWKPIETPDGEVMVFEDVQEGVNAAQLKLAMLGYPEPSLTPSELVPVEVTQT